MGRMKECLGSSQSDRHEMSSGFSEAPRLFKHGGKSGAQRVTRTLLRYIYKEKPSGFLQDKTRLLFSMDKF